MEDAALGPMLRLARDRAGKDLLPTPSERAEAEAAEARAEAERTRAENERLQAELTALRAQLAAGKPKPRKPRT